MALQSQLENSRIVNRKHRRPFLLEYKAHPTDLTEDEHLILKMLANRATNGEIGEELGLDQVDTRAFLSRLYDELGVRHGDPRIGAKCYAIAYELDK